MSRLLSVVLLTVATVPLGAQAPPTFRTGANSVRVDMYPTLGGEMVDDLRLDEIEILEDGVRQVIDTLEHVLVRPASPEAARTQPATVGASPQSAADSRARVFVIFIDTLHTQVEGSAGMRVPLVRFLDRVLGQDDLVALMTPEMSAADLTFGRKTAVLSNIMQTEWTWGRGGRLVTEDPKERLYEACYPDVRGTETAGVAADMIARHREGITLDALDDLVVHVRGLREERKAVLTVTDGWRLFAADRRLASIGRREAPRSGLSGLFGRERRREVSSSSATGSMRTECDADRVALALADHSQRLRALAEGANRANASFYPVFARDLAPPDAPNGPAPTADRANLEARQDSLRQLATSTDGMAVVGTTQIDAAPQRIVADLSSYYLLGYSSTNTKLDGRFRTISVRVRRPGVQVRARRGYRGLTAEELLDAVDGETPEASPSAGLVSVVLNPRAPFRIRTATWAAPASRGEASVWVVGELDYTLRRELAWTAGATAEVVLLAADGTEVVSSTVPVAASEGTFSIRLPETGGIPPGDYALRVRVHPDVGSGLPVTDSVRLSVPAATAVLGEAVIWRRGPSTGLTHLVTADPRFQRRERIRFEMATATAGTATARLLDRAGNLLGVPVQISARPDPSGLFRWIVAEAVLAPLAAGDYAIEVTLAGATQVSAFQVVP